LAATGKTRTTATATSAYELQLEGVNYTNFIDGIPSPASKRGYRNAIARYCRYLKITKVDDLMLHSSNPKLIEEQMKGSDDIREMPKTKTALNELYHKIEWMQGSEEQ
jgi:hypothetical protein